jgi:predicted HTH domain antitoxin
MSEQLNIRLDRTLLTDFEELAKNENLDRSSLIKKILIDGLNQERLNYAIQKYLQQIISLERAAEIAKISVHEMIQVLAKYGISSQFTVEDFQKMVE